MKVRTLLVLLTLVTALLGQTAPTFSTAAFTSSSSTAESTIQAAADWTAPEVSMTSPGSAVRDTVTVSASASDVDSETRSVTIEHRGPNAAGWTVLCTSTSAPYSCSWNTKDGDDGAHSLRATATDTHGNTATSEAVTTTVANQVTVVVTAPSQTIRGSAAITTTLHNAGSTPYRVTVEFAPAGTAQWSTACANLSSPYTCSGNTVAMPDGLYDLRATATAGTATVRSEIVRSIRVDNTAPSVTMTNPGSPLAGTRTFASTATDSGSGVAKVTMQYTAAGSGTWTDLCTVASAPYSCSYDTKKLTDGTYSFRSIATDSAGNNATSAAVTNRVIKNTVSEVTMANPGSALAGATDLSASATSTAGVSSVAIQYAASGSSTWTTACTVTRSPYSCSWDSTRVENGGYSFRAVLTDGNGSDTVSSVVTGSRVNNTVMEALGIQVYNGRSTGKVDAGDRINYILSEQPNFGSISSGWTGGARSVTVRLQDNSSGDRITILSNSGTVNLGSLDLGADYIGWGQNASFNATMSSTSTWFNGAWRESITVTLGSQSAGSSWSLSDRVSPSVMSWSPSTAATNTHGTQMSPTRVGVWTQF